GHRTPRLAEKTYGSIARALALGAVIAGTFVLPLIAAPVKHGISAGLIKVTQLSSTDDNTAGLGLALLVNDFRLAGGNRADYNVQIGPVRTDDPANGVLISCISENGRNNFGTNAFATPAIASGAAGYSIVSWTGGSEYNVNVAGAYFPYSK